MSEQRPWLWTCWQWQSAPPTDAAPGWVLTLVEQSEGEDEPEDTVFYTLAIGAPGGVDVDLGRVSRHPKLERGFASEPPNYQWWMHTNYGTWEVCYRDPEPYGRLELCVYASQHSGDWANVTLREVPHALIAELSDCLELPPEEWPLRPGWEQKGHTEHIPQTAPREPRQPAAVAATPVEEGGLPNDRGGRKQWKGSILDQFEQQLRFAVNLITIIEHARNRFETFIEDMKPRYIADNGSKAFATDLELIEGMGYGTVWLNPDSTVRFNCDIVENNTSLELVQSQLDMIVSQIVDYLSRDWMVNRKPLSGPYEDALLAIHKRWKLEMKSHIIPRVDKTSDASLDVLSY